MSKSDESSKPQILYEFVESGSMHDLLNSHWGMSPYTFAYSQNAIIHINKLMQITINPIEGEFSKDQLLKYSLEMNENFYLDNVKFPIPELKGL